MKRTWLAFGIVMLLVVLLAGPSQAFEIFFWQHDNGVTTTDRVFNSYMTTTQSLTRTLDNLDLDYDLNRNLPDDLSGYDLVMTSLSFFCPD